MRIVCGLGSAHLDHVTLASPSTTQHVSLSPQCPCTPRLLLVPLLLRLSPVVSPLPRKSSRRLTGNRRRRHSPRPPLLAAPQDRAACQLSTNATHVELDAPFIRPLLGSASCWTCRMLDSDLLDLNRMFACIFHCLRLVAPFLLVPLPSDIVYAALFDPAPLSRPDIPFIAARSFIHWSSLCVRCRAACRWQNPTFLFSPFAIPSFLRVAHIVSSFRTQYIYPSPVLVNTRQLWPHLSSLLSVCAGQLWPISLSLSRRFPTRLLRPRILLPSHPCWHSESCEQA